MLSGSGSVTRPAVSQMCARCSLESQTHLNYLSYDQSVKDMTSVSTEQLGRVKASGPDHICVRAARQIPHFRPTLLLSSGARVPAACLVSGTPCSTATRCTLKRSHLPFVWQPFGRNKTKPLLPFYATLTAAIRAHLCPLSWWDCQHFQLSARAAQRYENGRMWFHLTPSRVL